MIENVLSLFDGHSGCQIALKELGIIPKKYFASEIDKHAIKATMQNFPNTIQLGSVVDIDVSKLPKIDLLSGGSPCQSFSFAGKRKGMSTVCEIEILTLEHYLQLKSEGYEFEGQSYLFWEYMRVLTELKKVNPDILFLLENVEMGKKWEGVLSKAIGINGLHINSALVSAQNRERIYWLNWHTKKDGLFGYEYPNIPQPKDRGIFLKDILEAEVDEKYYLSDKALASILGRKEKQQEKGNGFGVKIHNEEDKMSTLKNGGSDERGIVVIKKDGSIKPDQNKAACFTAGGHSGGNHSDMDLIVAMRGRGDNNEQQLEQRKDGETNTITSVQKDNLIMSMKLGRSPDFQRQNTSGKAYALETGGKDGFMYNNRIRRLTEKECARLQTIPEWFSFDGISSTQIYRQIGNGWTIEVIKYLLSFF